MLTTQQWVGLFSLLKGEEPRHSGRGHPVEWPWWVMAGLSLWCASCGWSNRQLALYLQNERWPKPFRRMLPKKFRRRIPDESTLSRRFGSPKLMRVLRRVLFRLALPTSFGAVDGMVLGVGHHSTDPNARFGGPGSHFRKGYKAVRLVNAFGQACATVVGSADQNELALGQQIVEGLSLQGLSMSRIGADLAYDSEDFRRQVAEQLGALLVAPTYPRGRRGQKGKSYLLRTGRYRRAALQLLRSSWGRHWYKRRGIVERSIGWLRQGPHHLGSLPAFVRRTHRVVRWMLSHEVLLSYRKRLRIAEQSA